MLDKGMLLHTKPLATFRDVTAGKFDDVVALRSFLDMLLQCEEKATASSQLLHVSPLLEADPKLS
jgi:hypothetical protein